MRTAELTRAARDSGPADEIIPDLACLPLAMVNVAFVGPPAARDRGWALVDAGMTLSAPKIIRGAAARYGPDSRPAALILTHGHFDHVGSARALADLWDVPVYAHPLELPYLTGRSDYPPPDPTVGGGMIAAVMSRFFSRRAVDLGGRVRPLPADGTVPGMDGWRWAHTPGHTPGHVALFRESDRALIAGDAFVTTRQESALAVITARKELRPPPAYFTQDWHAARRSVDELARLRPSVAVTGHGLPMRGEELTRGLDDLVRNFEREMPSDGRYVRQPALADEGGLVSVPPRVSDPLPAVAAGVGLAVLAGLLMLRGGSDDRMTQR